MTAPEDATMPARLRLSEGLGPAEPERKLMAQEKSLADKLVFFMRMRDEARAKLELLDQDGELWPMLAMMLDDREKAVVDALYEQTMAVDRIGRLAEWAKTKNRA